MVEARATRLLSQRESIGHEQLPVRGMRAACGNPFANLKRQDLEMCVLPEGRHLVSAERLARSLTISHHRRQRHTQELIRVSVNKVILTTDRR